MKLLKKVASKTFVELTDSRFDRPIKAVSSGAKPRLTKAEKFENFFSDMNHDIAKYGYKTMKNSTILGHFNIGKRSSKSVQRVIDEFKERGLYTQPEYSMQLRLDASLRIFNLPVRQLGDLFKSERLLESFVEKNELYKEFGIKNVKRQHRPTGTRDLLDFKGETDQNEVVVIELKNGGGGKSAVEQVLRYAGQLAREFPNSHVRKILVTGIQNHETLLALRGMGSEERSRFEWYLYKYFQGDDTLKFERVDFEAVVDC